MIRGVAARLERVWYPVAGGNDEPPAALRAASAVHALATRARAAMYDGGLRGARRLLVPCVSVGNLSVGGTGKTPLVAWLLDALLALGARPAVISRGYGGMVRGPERVASSGHLTARRFGDEPAMLAARYPHVPVLVGRDRHAAGMLAATSEGATVVVADDAFQHRRLARDLDIAVFDAWRGFGNGRQLPAGPLREAPSALARAALVVLTRVVGAPDLDGLRRAVARLAPGAALVEADLEFSALIGARTGQPATLGPGAAVYAFCGIANPGSFRRTLEARGFRLAGWEIFPDHHAFRPAQIARLERTAAASGAVAAVTTAKDAVRLSGWGGPFPLYRAEVKLAMIRGRETLWEKLRSIMAGGRG